MPVPLQTFNYMIAGYAVIFGVMLVYVVSLVVRTRNLRRDEQILRELEEQAPAAPAHPRRADV